MTLVADPRGGAAEELGILDTRTVVGLVTGRALDAGPTDNGAHLDVPRPIVVIEANTQILRVELPLGERDARARRDPIVGARYVTPRDRHGDRMIAIHPTGRHRDTSGPAEPR